MIDKYLKPQINIRPALVFMLVCFGYGLFIGGCITRSTVPVVTTKPDGSTVTNPLPVYLPDPRINAYSNTAAGVAAAVAPVNPYAGITDYALKAAFGLAGAIAGYAAQKRNTSAAQTAATQNQSLLNTVIQGVESLGPSAAPVKQAIQTRATAAGLQPALDAVVQNVT